MCVRDRSSALAREYSASGLYSFEALEADRRTAVAVLADYEAPTVGDLVVELEQALVQLAYVIVAQALGLAQHLLDDVARVVEALVHLAQLQMLEERRDRDAHDVGGHELHARRLVLLVGEEQVYCVRKDAQIVVLIGDHAGCVLDRARLQRVFTRLNS